MENVKDLEWFLYGSGDGDGDGYGSGDGIKSIYDMPVHMIDGIQTIIMEIKRAYSAAYGYVLQCDLSLKKCWVAKSGGVFAHGATLKEAREALADKLYDNLSVEERIAAFWECHNTTDKYNGRDLWLWHHRLTGSCEFGRNQFAEDHGIDIDNSSFTVEEFIDLCKNEYGGAIIKKLLKNI